MGRVAWRSRAGHGRFGPAAAPRAHSEHPGQQLPDEREAAASAINLMVTLAIVVIVITIYVKTDFISVCPVFFVSGRQVYKAIISDQSKEAEFADPSIRQEVIIITREKSLNLNNKFRTVKLISNIFYLSSNGNNDDSDDF
jgi:hypothetical protein